MKYEEPEMCVTWVKQQDVIVTSLGDGGDITNPTEPEVEWPNQ